MKCPKCGGEFKSGGLNYGRIRYAHHFVDMPGFGVRVRTCAKCGYRTKTAEIDIYQYMADSKLIMDLFDILETYTEERNKRP